MKRDLCLLFLSLVFAATAASAVAGTITVPGDYTTIQAAVTAAVAGDEIVVTGGPYTENVWIHNLGHSRDGITIEGPGVTLNGGFFIEQSNGSGAADVTIDGFTIEGGGFSGSTKNGIRVHATGATISNCTIGGVTGSQSRAIESASNSHNLVIEGCQILASNLNGIYLNGAGGVICRGNYLEKGIGSDSLTDFLAEYNVFNGSSFGCGPGGSGITLQYNDFINNTGRAVTWYKEGATTGDFNAENNWWGSANGPSDALGTVETDGTTDPGVADALNIEPAGALGATVSDADAGWTTQPGTNHIDYVPWLTGPNNISLVVDDVICGKNQTAELKATLTDNGVGLAGKEITFSVDGTEVGTGTTDPTGLATLSYLVTLDLGDYEIKAQFVGDATTLPATGYGTLSVPVPNEVWVDDDWAGTPAGTEVEPGKVFGYNAFESMVTATAAVSPNGTVNVAAGTYVGYLVANKPVTYLGANAGVHPAVGKHPSETVGTRGPESILTNSYYALKPAADDITVDGFLFTGTAGRIVDTYADANNFHLTNCIFDNSSAATSQGIIQFGGGSHVNMLLDFNLLQDQGQHTLYLSGGPYTGLTVQHNNFAGTGNGIFQASQPISGFSLTENIFTGGETGINMGTLDNPTITGNEFEAMSFCGVQVGTQGGTISGNDFHDFTGYVSGPTTYGFGVDLFGGQWGTWTCDGLQVSNNAFTGNPQGISIRGGVDGANVTGNTITDCGTGIWVRASGGITALGANTVADNDILGTGTCGVLLDGVTGPDLALGGTEIAAGIAEFIRLTSCPINVDAMGVTFGGAANGAEIEAKVWHRYDDPALGLVSYPDSRTDTAIAVTNAAGKRGQTVQLQAKLTAGGANLAGMSLAFWLDGTELGGAVTDAAGIARLTYTIDAAATVGGHDLLALFGGDATYKPALGEGTLTVEPATATGITLTLDVNPVDAGGLVTATVMGDNGVDYTAVAGYAIQPGAGGSWAGNVYTSSKAGTWTVQATYGPLGDTAELEVTSGAVASVAISPADATIAVGDTLTYTVEVTDAQGNTWVPTVAAADWTVDGTFTGTFDDANTFTATGAGTGTVSCEVDGIAGNAAALTVNAAGGAGLILAWDKDDQNFYLCSNPADPQSAGAGGLISGAANGTFVVSGVTVIVTGSTNNRTVTVYNDAGIQNTLQVRWYVRGGVVSQAYLYSTIAGTRLTASYRSLKTYVDGQYKTGFWGLTHTLDAVNPTSITYGSAEQ